MSIFSNIWRPQVQNASPVECFPCNTSICRFSAVECMEYISTRAWWRKIFAKWCRLLHRMHFVHYRILTRSSLQYIKIRRMNWGVYFRLAFNNSAQSNNSQTPLIADHFNVVSLFRSCKLCISSGQYNWAVNCDLCSTGN